MKDKIHPEYKDTTIVCACGATFQTKSTKQNIHIDICSQCHPFFTGKQKLVDSAGRVDKFLKRYQKQKPKNAEQTRKAETPKDAEKTQKTEAKPAEETQKDAEQQQGAEQTQKNAEQAPRKEEPKTPPPANDAAEENKE